MSTTSLAAAAGLGRHVVVRCPSLRARPVWPRPSAAPAVRWPAGGLPSWPAAGARMRRGMAPGGTGAQGAPGRGAPQGGSGKRGGPGRAPGGAGGKGCLNFLYSKAQRRLAKASKGTPTRAKCRKVVAHIHERIANRRDNFCHQEARKLVNTHGVLAFEALHIANMMLNSCLTKSIADVAWSQFVRITTDKAACAGRRVAHVDPRYTSQDCSRCGQRVPKSLSQRVHQCPTCQLVMDRDHNAAINILRCGLASLGLAPRSPRL